MGRLSSRLTLRARNFSGPRVRAVPPAGGAVEVLPAGGSISLDIACHVAWSKYGWRTAEADATLLNACPFNSGAYHSGDPAEDNIDTSLLSGCALGIANVDDINDVSLCGCH